MPSETATANPNRSRSHKSYAGAEAVKIARTVLSLAEEVKTTPSVTAAPHTSAGALYCHSNSGLDGSIVAAGEMESA